MSRSCRENRPPVPAVIDANGLPSGKAGYGVSMRTTLTIEPDVAMEIERRRRLAGGSLKRVINSLLRKGLRAEAEAPPTKPYRSETFDLHFRPRIDPLKLNQLVDELDVDA